MSKRRGNFLLLGALIGFIAGLFFAPKKGSELRRDAKNKIDEIYGEDSIEVLYLEDRQMNSKIIYKEEGGGGNVHHILR